MASTDANGTPWTVGRLLSWTTQFFADKQVEGGRLAAELLLAQALGCRKIELYTRFEVEPSEEQRGNFRELVRSAAAQTPIAYLLGRREFFSLEFEVTPAVLIPRPETEALVQRAIDLCRTEPERTWQILDVGTGSGCIAAAIAKYAANAHLTGSDISADAIAVARRNLDRLGLDERARVCVADLTALPAENIPPGGFDLIVSNPPYISEAIFADLPPHIRDHEPRVALTGATGSNGHAAGWTGDGLACYRRLAAEASRVLVRGGRLLVEIGAGQGDAVRAIFAEAGGWDYLGAHRDPADPHERVLEWQRT